MPSRRLFEPSPSNGRKTIQRPRHGGDYTTHLGQTTSRGLVTPLITIKCVGLRPAQDVVVAVLAKNYDRALVVEGDAVSLVYVSLPNSRLPLHPVRLETRVSRVIAEKLDATRDGEL